MSVVNKMLQDLEARKAEPNASSDYQAPQPSNSKRIFIYGALGLVVLAFSVWLYFDNSNSVSKGNSSSEIHLVDNATNNTSQGEQKITTQLPVEQAQQPSDVASESAMLSDKNDQEPLSAEQLQAYSFNQNRPTAAALDETAQQSKAASSVKMPIETQNVPDTNSDDEKQVSESLLLAQDSVANQISSKVVSIKSLSSNTVQTENKTEVAITGDSDSVFEVRSSQNIDSVEGLKQQVQIALRRGDQKEAIRLLTKLLDKTPDNILARKRLAAMLFAQGNHLQADEILRHGVILQPDNQEMRIMQARLWVQMKNPTKALELLNDFKVSAVQAPDYISYRASLARQVSRFDTAKSDYRQLTQSQPANARWWLGLAVAEEKLGNNQPALQAYINAKDLDQLSSEVNDFVQQRIQYLAGVK